MCLSINPDQIQNEEDLNKWLGRRKNFVYVYKVLRKRPNEDFYRSAWYKNFIWDFSKQKVFQVDRSPIPTKDELDWGGIVDGLHVYTSIKGVKKDFLYNGYNSHHKNVVIVKFRVNRKDVVAVENYYIDKEDNFQTAVCKKLTFVKIVED
jgi:hypothetical protein